MAGTTGLTAQSPHLPAARSRAAAAVETIYRAVEPRVDRDAAMALVTKMAPLWRLAGNPQFDQSLEWIDAALKAAGIATRYDTIPSASQGWEMRDAVLRLDGPAGEVVLSREQDRVPLAINSFPTPAGGTAAAAGRRGRGHRRGELRGQGRRAARWCWPTARWWRCGTRR